MLRDSVSAKGRLSITLIDSNGDVKDQREINNLVVSVGKSLIASRLVSNTSAVMTHMAVGTANTTPFAGQTSLGTEIARVEIGSASASVATVSYSATFPMGTGTGVLTEAGIFNAANAGIMLSRTRFNPITKTSGDTLIIGWNITVQ